MEVLTHVLIFTDTRHTHTQYDPRLHKSDTPQHVLVTDPISGWLSLHTACFLFVIVFLPRLIFQMFCCSSIFIEISRWRCLPFVLAFCFQSTFLSPSISASFFFPSIFMNLFSSRSFNYSPPRVFHRPLVRGQTVYQ